MFEFIWSDYIFYLGCNFILICFNLVYIIIMMRKIKYFGSVGVVCTVLF